MPLKKRATFLCILVLRLFSPLLCMPHTYQGCMYTPWTFPKPFELPRGSRGSGQNPIRLGGVGSPPPHRVHVINGTYVFIATLNTQLLQFCFQSNFAEIRPYRLLLDLNDIPRTLSSVVDGRQPLADLSVSPRIRRQGGENTATVCVPLLALI